MDNIFYIAVLAGAGFFIAPLVINLALMIVLGTTAAVVAGVGYLRRSTVGSLALVIGVIVAAIALLDALFN